MRSILENVEAYGLRVKSGYKIGYMQLAIAAAFTVVEPAPYLIALDPGSTTRVVTMPAVTAADNGLSHEILNISTGTGNLTLNNAAASTLATLQPGGFAEMKVVGGVWVVYTQQSASAPGTGQKQTLSLYTKLADLANTNVMAVNVPFPFTCTAIRFRPRVPATTAAKLATLTGGIAASGTGALSAMTGGVLSLTSANMTPTNTPVAATTPSASNTGVAGAALGVTISAVTAFVEGDGQLEFDVTNTS